MRIRNSLAAASTVVLATTAIMAATAATSSASSTITWTQQQSGQCLSYSVVLGSIDGPWLKDCAWFGPVRTDWIDSQRSDGTWLEHPAAGTDICMTAYKDQSVYFEKCKMGTDGQLGNDWERWYEVKEADGWHLMNKATDLWLDGSNGNIYALPFNSGPYQIWH